MVCEFKAIECRVNVREYGEMDSGIAAFCLALCLESRLSRENAVLKLVRLVLCFKRFKVAGYLYAQVSDDLTGVLFFKTTFHR